MADESKAQRMADDTFRAGELEQHLRSICAEVQAHLRIPPSQHPSAGQVARLAYLVELAEDTLDAIDHADTRKTA